MGIEKDLRDRNERANNRTKKILDECRGILDDLFVVVSNDRMSVEWTTLDFHPITSKLLNFIGIAKYNSGQTVKNEYDEVIFIDESNQDNYTKTIMLIAPTHLIDVKDFNGIIQFMEEYSKLARDMEPELLTIMLSDEEFLAKNFTAFGGKDGTSTAKRKSDRYEGFDLSDLDLDELQLKQLKLTNPGGQA